MPSASASVGELAADWLTAKRALEFAAQAEKGHSDRARRADRVRFASVTAGHPVIAALEHLRALETGTEKVEAAPRSVITEAWRPLVVVDGRVDRRGYALCVLDRLRLALRRRDVYVVDGDRWGDPRRLLVEPATWKSVGPQVMRTLDLPDRAPSYLDRLGQSKPD